MIGTSLTKAKYRLKVLFLSGCTDDTLLRQGVSGGGEAFLQKPFALTAFARKVREVVDRT